MVGKILIVDDETSILSTLSDILEDEGFKTEVAESAEEGMNKLEKGDENTFQAVLLDIWMPGIDGIELLDWIKQQYPKLPVIMMSGHGTIETAVKATKKGAYDFIEKPLSLDAVLITLNHALKESALERENEELKRKQAPQYVEIIGKSLAIKAVLEQTSMAAPTDSWVLINGENGTGKELVARQIHFQSTRKSKPFIELNCAAIPEEMIESELFGHEKGAFPGAINRKIGKFDQANGGTLFLDEIGDMSLKTQSKILRVLQEQRFERVGGTEMFEVDIRIIAASNKNLQEEIAAGNFREDLFYRLNVIPIDIPPLKDRKEDIPILIDYFLKQFSADQQYPKKRIGKEALNSMVAYHWPGNVRELKNIVERIVIMVKDTVIGLKHVPPAIRMANEELLQVNEFPSSFKEAREAFEKQFVQSMLKKNRWNITKTAGMIQVERSNLHRKIKQLGIVVPK
ncbi:MAG: sigma-54-dependent Fis family transcriptional regulator [Proteobacteria bacterium]|nr:sigma-54-dependent Fis family transcriptional regulator [Pseudomonadota bacterium]